MSGPATQDGFLGGRITLAQPAKGFRAGHDSVLLAAAVPAKAGERVLELGSGAGVAALCLAARVSDCFILGIEIDPGLAALAVQNAAANGMAERVRFRAADVVSVHLEPSSFDHALFNPPFHPDTGQVSPSAPRDRAMRDSSHAVTDWTRVALGAVSDGGTITAVLRADRLEEVLAAAGFHAAMVFPLFPRVGEAPKRVLIRIVKGAPGGMSRGKGLVLHQPDGRPTAEAEAVLRHAAALDLA